jgi:hypothetical protein
MSYHKFSNFGEKLNCDLNAKVNSGLEDVSEWNLDCVCRKRCKKGNGDCAYRGNADSRWLFTIYTENAAGRTT